MLDCPCKARDDGEGDGGGWAVGEWKEEKRVRKAQLTVVDASSCR